MIENVDELLLCKPYIDIWALVVGRFLTMQTRCSQKKMSQVLQVTP